MMRPTIRTSGLHTFALDLCNTLLPPAHGYTLAPNTEFVTLDRFHQLLAQHGVTIGKRKLYSWTSVTREHLPETVQTILRHAPSMWYVTITGPAGGGQRGRSKVIPAPYLHEPSRLLASASKLTTTLQAQLPVKHTAIIQMLTRQPHSTTEHLSRQLKAEGLPVTKRYVNKVKRVYLTGRPSCKPL